MPCTYGVSIAYVGNWDAEVRASKPFAHPEPSNTLHYSLMFSPKQNRHLMPAKTDRAT